MSYYRDQLEAWLKTIDVKAERVLDAGGGALPVKDRVNSWEVQDYKILDAKTEAQKEKSDFVFDLNEVLDAVDMRKIGLFDIVFCLEVFEYVWNPVFAIKNLARFMKSGSTLYVTFPFVYPVHNPVEYDSLRYTLRGAVKLLEVAGLEVVKITSRKDKSGLLTAFYSQDGMHPSKEVSYHNATGWLIEARKL